MTTGDSNLKLLREATQAAIAIGVTEQDAKFAHHVVQGMLMEFVNGLQAFCTDGTVPGSQLHIMRLTIVLGSMADTLGAGIGASARDIRNLEEAIERASTILRTRARAIFNAKAKPSAPAAASQGEG